MPNGRTAKSIASNVFSDNREAASSEQFKGMASEVLAVLPFIEQFCATVLEPCRKLPQEIASFYKMCDIVALLQKIKISSQVVQADLDELQALQQAHFALFLRAYSESQVRPKHHFSLHLPKQFARDRTYMDCFALERKHKLAKQEANDIHNAVCWEASLLTRLLHHTLQGDKPDAFSNMFLSKSVQRSDLQLRLGASVVMVGSGLRYNMCRYFAGDVLQDVRGNAMQVAAALLVDNDWQLLVRTYTPSGVSGRAKLWAYRAVGTCVLSQHRPLHASCWTFQDDGRLLTLGI